MAIKRNTTASTNPFNNWNPPLDDNCQICDTVKSLSKGVIGHQEINKTHKKYPGGWPTSEKPLKQSVQYTLCQSIPVNSTWFYPSKYQNSWFWRTQTLRYHYVYVDFVQMFLGDLLESVCEHIFCFSCFAKYIKSKLESENFRPTCNINFKIDNIKLHQKKLLDLLKVTCSICPKKFNINSDYELYT